MSDIPAQVYKTIKKIEIYTTKAVNDLLAGAYHSAFKGQGIEFEEVRDYQPGDDIRSIDWNVTARMGHPYVKSFREERELTVFLLVDISGSNDFGKKSEVIAELGATLAFSAIANQDKVGLILFSDEVEHYLPPKKGTRHVLRVIRDLLVYEPKNKGTNIKEALSFLQRVHKRQAICFLISDFIDSEYDREMVLASKHYDLIPVRIVDPKELQVPSLGWIQFSDLETGEVSLLNSSNKQTPANLASAAQQRSEEFKQSATKAKCDPLIISTDRSPIEALSSFFKIRKQKKR